GRRRSDDDRESIQARANRVASQSNLRQLAIGMIDAGDAHQFMPPAAITDPKTGKPLLSWRVAPLPYVQQVPPHQQFHPAEPWDSPHNFQLLKQMPKIYSLPGTEAKEGHTFYQVFVGPKTPFDTTFAARGGPFGLQGPRMPASFSDGTSMTILIAEAAEA